MMLLLLSLGSDECKQKTVAIVGQLKVISIKTPKKILLSVKSSAVKMSTNESGRAYLNTRSLCSEQNQIDLGDLIGEKEREAF